MGQCHTLSPPSLLQVASSKAERTGPKSVQQTFWAEIRGQSPDNGQTTIMAIVEDSATEQDDNGNCVEREKISQFRQATPTPLLRILVRGWSTAGRDSIVVEESASG